MADRIRIGYCVLRLTVEELSGESYPVGVVAWDAARDWVDVRVLQEDETAKHVKRRSQLLLTIIDEQLRRWMQTEQVPYHHERMRPSSSEFWVAAADALTAGFKLDPPKALEEAPDPLSSLESLFEAIVQPRQPVHRRRIDGALTRALGGWTQHLRSGLKVPCFDGKTVKVRRGLQTVQGAVVVEAVNLATPDAHDEADLLTSRLRRVKVVHPSSTHIVWACPDSVDRLIMQS